MSNDAMSNGALTNYWSQPADALLGTLQSARNGLDETEAAARLQRHGANALTAVDPRRKTLMLFLGHFRSPLVLILVVAAGVALLLREWLDAGMVLFIIFVTAILGFLQEYRASNAVEALRQRVAIRCQVLRGGRVLAVPATQVVPGDIVQLSAGSLIPADGVLLDARDFFVSQSILTGETFPVEKKPGVVTADAGVAERNNCVFMGTSVRSGTATALIVETGAQTAFGQVAERLKLQAPETEFERGLRQFGTLLVQVMLVMVLVVLAMNIVLQHPTVDTVLFALALAVGLSPELLPAILTITLSHGARKLAARRVIVKRLSAIENLGSMDVLCTDKTGTLTKGVVHLDAAFDCGGKADDTVLQLATLNASLQTGLANPLDEAVMTRARESSLDLSGFAKLDEIPYDFARKRLSVVVQKADGDALLITKGALQNVLDVCDRVQQDAMELPLTTALRDELMQRFGAWSEQGFRVLGLAQKAVATQAVYARDIEQAMVFRGFLLFFDPPEPGVKQTLDGLRQLGVRLTVITGDNRFVARHVAEAVGLEVERVVTGAELAVMKDEALWHIAPTTTVFAEVDPNQKERIILALQKSGHVVGYLGDGINDAPALHAADVGISVDQAVDVAKEAADFVLLDHDLEVLRQGIDEGRHTFANTLKYIFITTSANFGNMISMALASLFLPFLPLLASQILLNNLLSDIPSMGIAGDNVDRDWETTPHRWDVRLIRNFMITFGLVSTVFDLLTFALLWQLMGDRVEVFRTGWFVESLLSELLILFVIRSAKPFYRSRAGKFLTVSTVIVVAFTLLLPFIPLGAMFGFVPLPAPVLGAIVGITLLYLLASEFTKRYFFRRFGFAATRQVRTTG